LQAEYAAWFDALPDNLRDTATAEALQAIVDLELDELAEIVPPREIKPTTAATISRDNQIQ
jgi:hypothetical protein